MTTGSILFGLAIFIVVVFFVARPFWVDTRPRTLALPSPRQQLLMHKDVLLEQIQQMDFDNETGKIDPELYERSRPRLLEQAALILKQLDELADPQTEDAIETAIARVRAGQPAPVATATRAKIAPSRPDDDIEAAIARRRTGQAVALATPAGAATVAVATNATNGTPVSGDRFCSGCGRPFDADDRFCPSCGRVRR